MKEMLLIQVQKILALRDKVAVVTDLKKEVGCKDVRERVRAQLGRRDVPAQKKHLFIGTIVVKGRTMHICNLVGQERVREELFLIYCFSPRKITVGQSATEKGYSRETQVFIVINIVSQFSFSIHYSKIITFSQFHTNFF